MRSVTVTLVDDLDEAKPADETISFGLDGRDYEIDLSRTHAGELRKMASRYISVARRARTAVHQRPARRTQADRERARQIRAWAVENGLMTTERGRIPEHVTREYEASKRAESSRLPVKGRRAALLSKTGWLRCPLRLSGTGRRCRSLRLCCPVGGGSVMRLSA
jgi:Lsr2